MKPRTALGGDTPRKDSHGPVTLDEAPDTAMASCAGRRAHLEAAQNRLAGFVGLALPGPGRLVADATFTVFWTGPDQWMITAPHNTHETLAADIKAAVAETASVTEQNDAWCRFDLTGDGLAPVFERLCPINMRASQPGDATRTRIDHLGCFVLIRAPQEISVFGPRSSAGSLHHALLTAIRSAH